MPLATPDEIKRMVKFANDKTVKTIAKNLGIEVIELTELRCGTWVIIPYFPAKDEA